MMHSLGKRAAELFSVMLEVRAKPNEITFICVLSAYSHFGLIEYGFAIVPQYEKRAQGYTHRRALLMCCRSSWPCRPAY